MERSYIGQSVKRLDAENKATAWAKYGADLTFPGMIYGKTLRSPYAHARVKRIDVSHALKQPGVLSVLIAEDIPGLNRYGAMIPDQRVLVPVGDTVKMIGDPVALAGAETEEIAEEAIRQIIVEYEPLEVIKDIDTALKADGLLVHEEGKGNLCGFPFEFQKGDVAKALSEADFVVEEVFHTPRQEHAYLEPESGVALINNRGEIEVYAACQSPDYIQSEVAKVLGWPASKVHVITPAVGGAFGGKTDMSLQAHLALLTLKTKRPVKIVWSRTESFIASSKRTPIRIHHKMGAVKDGSINALEVDFCFDGGAYASGSPLSLLLCGLAFPGPYDIPHIKLTGRVVYTNNPFSGAMRGFDNPQATMATEVQIDALSRLLNLDPVDLQLKNALVAGKSEPFFYFTPSLPHISLDSPVSLPQTLMKVKERAGELQKPSSPRKRTGRGICCSMPLFDVASVPQGGTKGTHGCVEMLADGSVVVRSSGVEMGQGLATMLAQIAAAELGTRIDRVSVLLSDTRATSKAGFSSGSRQTYCSGNALLQAAKKVRAVILNEAAKELKVKQDLLILKDNRVFLEDQPDQGIALPELAFRCYDRGINLRGEAWFGAEHAGLGHTFLSVVADVEVDLDTGIIEVIQLITALDVGKAINPQLVEGQLLGGEVQGLGYVLMEDMVTREGVILTPTLVDYLIPTALDLPGKIQNIIVEEPNPTGPYGARGMAEFGFEAVAPVIMNAVYDAVGVRFASFPLTPEKVLRAIRNRNYK